MDQNYRKEYYKKNKERERKKQKEYYEKNKEKVNEMNKAWRQNNRESWYKHAKTWQDKNPQKFRELASANANKRRVRLLRIEGSHTRDEWRTLCVEYGNECLRCWKVTKLTRDHIVPISLGGTDYIENIQPLCGPCNSSKGQKVEDYKFWYMVA